VGHICPAGHEKVKEVNFNALKPPFYISGTNYSAAAKYVQ